MKRILFVCLFMLVFLQLECNDLTPATALHTDCCETTGTPAAE